MEKTYEWTITKRKYVDMINMNGELFECRTEENTPKKGAYCKKCREETAKPVFAIYMNGQPAYALRCNKCGNEYPIYKSTYIRRYIGQDLLHGHMNPTHGGSFLPAMDRRARTYYDGRKKRVEDKMCEFLNCTHDEYREMKRQWEEEDKKNRIRLKRVEAEREAKYENEKREADSNERKKLIEEGIIKYVKNIGLVNTETGEVIKL